MSVNETVADSALEEAARNSQTHKTSEVQTADGLGAQLRVLAGLLVLSIVMTLGTLGWSARVQDQVAIDSSVSLTQTAMDLRIGNLERTVTDYAWWDAAFENTSENFNPAWYSGNFGDYPYLTETFDITSTFVFAPGNEVLAYSLNAEEGLNRIDSVALAERTTGLIALVESARRIVDDGFPTASDLLMIDGQLHIASARIIHPHTEELFAAAKVTPESGMVVVFVVPFDSVVTTLREDYGLADARYVSATEDPEQLALPLANVDGQSFGYLTWSIDRPSSFIYKVVLPAAIALVLCVGLSGFCVLRVIQRNQARLVQALIEARAADQAKIQFLSNVSHELRTPLNGVIGITQIMLRDELTESHRKFLDTLLTSANHLQSLISDLLDVTRIHADRLELHPEPFDLSTMIEESVGLVRGKARDKGIGLQMSLPKDHVGRVIGDPVRIKQVVVNLLDNAVKFTETGEAKIAVSTRQSGDCQHITMRVQDTGIGITPDDQERIFARFTQIDGAKSMTADGLGLGLPICKAIIDAMGGSITLDSTPGEGTEFRLEFELRRETAEEEGAGVAA